MTKKLVSLACVVLFLGVVGLILFRTNPPVAYPHAQLLDVKKMYLGTEPVVIHVKLNRTVGQRRSLVERAFANEQNVVTPKVIGLGGREDASIPTSVTKDTDDEYTVKATPPQQFRPGNYVLQVTLKDGVASRELTQNFTWGVLAINPDKSVYHSGETADLSMGVLDERGNMVCDASVSLTITDPKGSVMMLSTKDKTIQVHPGCFLKQMIVTPDYEAAYQVGEQGTYRMKLTATTQNGSSTINDSFQVDDSAPFSVSRTSATRIYPVLRYPMTFTITPTQDFSGDIIETVPASFAVYQAEKSDAPFTLAPSSLAEKKLIWHVNLKQGEQTTLSYTYDAPNISPEFFLLGPLRFVQNGHILFAETRYWQIANDAVTDLGVLASGTNTAASDRIVGFKRTSGDTFGSSYDILATPGDASPVYHVRTITSHQRSQEIIATGMKDNGELYAFRCTGGDCDASGDWSALDLDSGSGNNYVTISPAMTCGDTTTGNCERDFDIAQEMLAGRVMVAYGKSGAGNQGKVFYNLWNGSSMAGESSFTYNSGSAVDTKWIRTIPDPNSNRILVLAEDANSDLFAMIWDGSSFGNLSTMSTNLSPTTTQNFDGAIETNSGNILVVWAEGSSVVTNPYRYKTYSVGGGWDSSATDPGNIPSTCASTLSTTAATATNIGRRIQLVPDPQSNRIGVLLVGSTSSVSTSVQSLPIIWKSDGSTAGLTFASGLSCAISKSTRNQNGDVAWAHYNGGTPLAMFLLSMNISSTADNSSYVTWTSGSGFSSITDMPGAMVDAEASMKLTSSPNSDDILAFGFDRDEKVYEDRYTGGAWGSWGSTLVTLPPGATNNFYETDAYSYSDMGYFPWSMNWRFYDGTDTTDTPTNALAAEDTAPTSVSATSGKVRLRFSVAEKGGIAETDSRKKLQYTSGCNPNTSETACTWTDVGAAGGGSIWRYVDCNGSSSVCNDNTTMSGTVLSGSPVAGWWNEAASGGTVTNMDQSADTTVELEYSIEANSASATTYYFRMFDIDQNAPVYRLQTSSPASPCAGTTACSYPSLTTSSVTATPTPTDTPTPTPTPTPTSGPTPVPDVKIRGGTTLHGGTKIQ